MTTALVNLDELDPALVLQKLTLAATQLQEYFPAFDLKRGTLHDLILQSHALLNANEDVNLTRYLQARSLLAIEQDPSLADADTADHVFSNWGVTRKIGTTATGPVSIVLSDNTSITLSRGTVFRANGREYVTTQVYTAKSEASLINSSTDRLMTRQTDGTYIFQINVEASEIGTESRLTKDTLLIPVVQPRSFVRAFATSDFSDGTNTETNQEVLDRLARGISLKTIGNRVNMAALLTGQEDFQSVISQSIVGAGDAEMLRDRHSIIPVSAGGRVDWYVRTQPFLLRQSLTVTATLIEKENGYGVWQFTLNRDTTPALYEVRNIQLPTDVNVGGGFEIREDIRSTDLSGDETVPDIVSTVESAYTRYQTVTIRFYDDVTATAAVPLGTSQSYTVEVVRLPLIAEIQDYINHRDVEFPGADTLVRAPIPCFVSLSFTIFKRTNDAMPDLAAIRTALTEAVNYTPFTGRLYASTLHDRIHGYLPNAAAVGAIAMVGRIRRADGTTRYLQDTVVLQVPTDPERLVSAKTAQFFLEEGDIFITVESSLP